MWTVQVKNKTVISLAILIKIASVYYLKEKPFFYPHTHTYPRMKWQTVKVEETFRFLLTLFRFLNLYCHMSCMLPLTVQLVVSSFLPKPESLAITVSYLAILFWPYFSLSFYKYYILIKILIYLESRYHVFIFLCLPVYFHLLT